jgi:DNA polymerase-3 subunit alpha
LGDSKTKVIAKEIYTLASVRQRSITALELSLDEKRISKELLEDLRDLVFSSPGDCRLLFRVSLKSGSALTIEANDRFNVDPSQTLINQIEELTGEKVFPTQFLS